MNPTQISPDILQFMIYPAEAVRRWANWVMSERECCRCGAEGSTASRPSRRSDASERRQRILELEIEQKKKEIGLKNMYF